MPTNIPPEAWAKFEEYKSARTPEEKLRKLREFLALMPKHKGTEKMEKFVRRRISQLREEIEKKRMKKSGRRGLLVEKRGAAQIVLLGFTNSGRSTVLSALTNARPPISPSPFTTSKPVEGMMQFRGAQVQVVEAPPLVRGGGGTSPIALALASNSDVLGVVVDGTGDPVGDAEEIMNVLSSRGIGVGRSGGRVRVRRTQGVPTIVVRNRGTILDGDESDLRSALESLGIHRAVVEIIGRVTLADVERAILGERSHKPAVAFVTRCDLRRGLLGCGNLRSRLGDRLADVICFSPENPPDPEDLGPRILKLLGLIRVFTKPVGQKTPSERALILEEESTVADAARAIHRDLVDRMRYARVWSERLPYSPMRVGPDFRLEDLDVLEIRV